MDFDQQLAAELDTTKPCKYAQGMEQIDPVYRDKILAHLSDLSASAIRRLIVAAGFSVGEQAVRKHLGGQCSCG